MTPEVTPLSSNQLPPSSVWQLKPWWCQPWSILLTGTGSIVGSWLLFHRVWLTSFLSLPVAIWMLYFVVIYPRLFAQLQAARSPEINTKFDSGASL